MSVTTTAASARPAWVTDALIAQWCAWVSRDESRGQTRQSPRAVDTFTAIAPFDLSPPRPPAGAPRPGARPDPVGNRQSTLPRHARRARHYLAPNRVRGMIPGLTKVREVRVPKGVVGIVSPWNYPLYLGVGDVLPALLAGNAVVSKADSQTALTLLWSRALMADAGLPADLWQIVAGSGAVVGTALVDAVDFVCFTGSTATGRTVAERAARRLVGASLELGGKNPLIVRADADLAYDAFRSELVRSTKALRLGQSYDYAADLGPLSRRPNSPPSQHTSTTPSPKARASSPADEPVPTSARCAKSGRRHGAEGIRKYTESQTVAEQRLLPLGPPPGKPAARFVAKTNRQLALLRTLRMR
ncbi:hypothetical protein ABH920_003379 [Catenulispora sp. EB89]|uniref:aldehyde dehydrogenase family protein n=1 Tax=Catenulispora sp. EB89 TaxID=3156257 RepID=UPI0035167E09